jgi:hypothetical protein
MRQIGTTGNFRMPPMRDLPVGQNQPASGDFACSFYSPPPARVARGGEGIRKIAPAALETLRGRGCTERAAHPDRTHRARRKADRFCREFVGWAKARLRRAHRLMANATMVGTLRFAPYGSEASQRQSASIMSWARRRYGRHRAAARQILQDRRCVLDERSGPLRSRNSRRRARAADQEDRVLRGVAARDCGRPANAIVECTEP